MNALYPGRFVLGLGVSHAPLVERGIGGTYAKPLATMRAYLDKMAAVPEVFEPGAGRPVRLLAALGPKMIELSGTHADGAHPYLVLPEQTTRHARHPRTRQVDRVRAGRRPSAVPPTSSCSGRTGTSRVTAGYRTTATRGCGRVSTTRIWYPVAPTGWRGRWSGWARSSRRRRPCARTSTRAPTTSCSRCLVTRRCSIRGLRFGSWPPRSNSDRRLPTSRNPHLVGRDPHSFYRELDPIRTARRRARPPRPRAWPPCAA